MQLVQAEQLHQFEYFIQATDAGVPDEIGTLTVRVHGLERNNGNEVNEEPAGHIVPNNDLAIVDDKCVVIVEARVEYKKDVNQEEHVDRVVDHLPRLVHVFKQCELHRRDDARVDQNECDEKVPVQLELIRW